MIVEPGDGITFEVVEQLDDENTVGLCEDVEPGSETIVVENGKPKFWSVSERRRSPEWAMDEWDPEDHIFISCEDGDVSVKFFPEFAPIETCITARQYDLVIDALKGEEWGRLPTKFKLMFDDAGIAAFSANGKTVCVAPVQWSFQAPPRAPTCGPRGPRGPSLIQRRDEDG